ncbi:MAG TPA: helix-turn-helix transcriptional regulator [Usitatibacter sp.]|nr:helix-turn-helix transcriptional regulator [Usitatibacter sp.]
MPDLPAIFRDRRIALGLRQEQVAAAANVSRRTLVSFESGEGGISLVNLRRLMAAVGLELTTREASRRLTLDELSDYYGAEDAAPKRKRVARKAQK